MGFFFKIVVQFGDHRIPIQVRYHKDRRTSGAKLRHLMTKIKEEVKEKANEEIDFRTHDFEVYLTCLSSDPIFDYYLLEKTFR